MIGMFLGKRQSGGKPELELVQVKKTYTNCLASFYI